MRIFIKLESSESENAESVKTAKGFLENQTDFL